MNTKILNFIKEMKETTKELFVYRVEYWQFSHIDELQVKYKLSSNLTGFTSVEKDSEEEIIQAIPLMRKMVSQLLEVKETSKQIAVKMLNSYPID